MEFALPAGRSVIVTDDGSRLTSQVVAALSGRGWPVTVLHFPADVVEHGVQFDVSIPQVNLVDLQEETIAGAIAQAAAAAGKPAIFIHLHPACLECQDGEIHFKESSRQILQAVFLAAKHLKEDLNQAASLQRGQFVSVVHLDGQFGLGEGGAYDPVSGGMFGLVKSLNLEWEAVYCRAIDLHPEIGTEEGAALVMTELLDPNRRIVEVGYGPQGRMTLALEAAAA